MKKTIQISESALREAIDKKLNEMTYERKTQDEFVILGNYGYGWEEVCCYDDYSEAKSDYKAYKENEPQYPHKLVKRRIKKENEPDKELHETINRSVKKAVKKVLNEGQYDNSPITKWVYWCYNYHRPEKWMDIFNGPKEHFMNKFNHYYDLYGAEGVMNAFFVNLDNENQKALIDYVMNNY